MALNIFRPQLKCHFLGRTFLNTQHKVGYAITVYQSTVSILSEH